MFNEILETVQALVLASIMLILWRASRDQHATDHRGWKFIFAGLGLLLFGSVLDIADNFENLNNSVVIADTNARTVLGNLVGFTGGCVVLGWGLLLWVPRYGGLSSEIAQRKLMESAMRESTADLTATSGYYSCRATRTERCPIRSPSRRGRIF
ncbi:MAG: hypothetical protein VCC99_14605 [Alphaproteobacteria bacterium]